MTHRDQIERALIPHGDRVLAAVRVAQAGAGWLVGLLAGLGAAIGYVLATGSEPSLLAAAIGGGAGGGAGAAAGLGLAALRFGERTPKGIYFSLAVTDRRVVTLRRSYVSNRPGEIVAEAPIDLVASIEVPPKVSFFPRKVTVRFADDTEWDLEAARVEHPEHLAIALGEARHP